MFSLAQTMWAGLPCLISVGTRSDLLRLSITTHNGYISGMFLRIKNMTKTNGGKADVTRDKGHYPDLAGY